MNLIKNTLLVFSFVPWAVTLSGQSLDSLRVSYNAVQADLTEILEGLSSAAKTPFFYDAASLPADKFSLQAEAHRLPDVLDRLFRTTRLGYVFYRDYAVFILPKDILQTNYTPEFYQTLEKARVKKEIIETEADKNFAVGNPDKINPTGKARIKVEVIEAGNPKEKVAGAVVGWPGLKGKDAVTDGKGIVETTLPTGEHAIKIQSVGYLPFEGLVSVWNDGEFTVSIGAMPNTLGEVLISGEAADANVSKSQIGVTRLDPKAIKKLPTLLGEADVVRSLLLTTGVTSVGEGAAGFNVRGGDTDQNLMLQDEMVLYNSSHALGFFSTYNTDLISRVELYKSIIPAEYGGRLSSVLDVRMSEGNMEQWKVKGGVGVVSGRLSIEGPIAKNKTSVIAGARMSYSDWVLQLFKPLEIRRSSASFFDGNFGLTHRFNEKNILILSGYAAGDKFEYNRSFGFDYRTYSGQLIYKATIDKRTFSRSSVSWGDYESLQNNFEGAVAGALKSGIKYWKAKEVWSKRIKSDLKLDFGGEATLYRVNGGEQEPIGPVSTIPQKALELEKGLEAALFASGEWTASKKTTMLGGLRINHYRYLGDKTVFVYDGAPSPLRVIDTVQYGKGATIAQQFYIEPRFSMRYKIRENASVKAGYSRTSQFINQIFNTDSPTPTSQYQLSTNYVPPFRAHNFSAGYFLNTRDNEWEWSGELFYRAIDKLWDYKDFAKLVVNEKLETEIREGVGKAYGLELSAKTSRPYWNGQMGYTFSRALRRVAGINSGNWYPSNFDKPHILNLTVNYQPTQRHTLTFNFTYSTGRPSTAPLTAYRYQNNIIIPVYSPRNEARIPDYHRLDVSYTIGQGYNKKRNFKTSWNISVYNVYARKNAFSVFFTQAPDLGTVANKLAILGTIFPAITLNIETK